MQNFMKLDQLLFILEREYPDMIAGRDYLLARRADGEGSAVEHARISVWPSGLEKPNQSWILERAAFYREAMNEAPVKAYRDQLLTATDWTQAQDVPPALAEQYAAFRQALRDVPQQPGWPLDVQWPVAPNGAAFPSPPEVSDVGVFEPALPAPALELNATMPPRYPSYAPQSVPVAKVKVWPAVPSPSIPEPYTPPPIDPSERPDDAEVSL
ncbi:hypothetical protein DF152_26225 [Burkholderia cenocepacia]|nr:hypothetical protein DF152_26225 [Burkholderia cenocepacia]